MFIVDKFQLQDDEYIFPYHYLTNLDNNIPTIYKRLSWGYEYITYIDFIRNHIEQKLKPNTMLDIGCGDGYLINSFDYDTSKSYKGFDLSERAIGFAKAFSDGHDFECIDLFKINAKFNVVCLIEVLEHIPDDILQTFIAEAFSKVEIGGHMIIAVPTTVDNVHKKHYRHYDESLLKNQCDLYNFELIEQVRLYKKSSILERLIKFSQRRNSKTLKRMAWNWHKKNTYFSDINAGKHLVAIYKRTS